LSDKPQRNLYSLLQQANIIQALLAQQGVSAGHLIAHDYGNAVAQELLRRQQEPEPDVSGTILSLCWLNGGFFAALRRVWGIILS
jgi:pimeloyl-ACP methyl ester carboxylesterase